MNGATSRARARRATPMTKRSAWRLNGRDGRPLCEVRHRNSHELARVMGWRKTERFVDRIPIVLTSEQVDYVNLALRMSFVALEEPRPTTADPGVYEGASFRDYVLLVPMVVILIVLVADLVSR